MQCQHITKTLVRILMITFHCQIGRQTGKKQRGRSEDILQGRQASALVFKITKRDHYQWHPGIKCSPYQIRSYNVKLGHIAEENMEMFLSVYPISLYCNIILKSKMHLLCLRFHVHFNRTHERYDVVMWC